MGEMWDLQKKWNYFIETAEVLNLTTLHIHEILKY